MRWQRWPPTVPTWRKRRWPLIEVDYEVLHPVLSLAEAMADGATIIHEDMTTFFKHERFARGDDTGVRGNIASHIQHKLGDVEKGFREADVVVEREFFTQTVHQGYIEPHAATATWTPEGQVDRLYLHAGLLRDSAPLPPPSAAWPSRWSKLYQPRSAAGSGPR